MSKRLYEVATDFGLGSEELVKFGKEHGLRWQWMPGKPHLTVLTDDQIDGLRAMLDRANSGGASQTTQVKAGVARRRSKVEAEAPTAPAAPPVPVPAAVAKPAVLRRAGTKPAAPAPEEAAPVAPVPAAVVRAPEPPPAAVLVEPEPEVVQPRVPEATQGVAVRRKFATVQTLPEKPVEEPTPVGSPFEVRDRGHARDAEGRGDRDGAG
jgi:hypothetical protein